MRVLIKITYAICFLVALQLDAQSNYTKRKHVEPYETSSTFVATSNIDKAVQKNLNAKKIAPTYICSDSVFLRRVYLDLLGRIPTAREAYNFLDNPAKNKRALLIDELLNSDEFALFTAFRWSDIFKIKAEFPINLWPNAAQAYNKYILSSLVENKPYNEFTYEMLTSSGSNFRVGPVNFYRALQGRGTSITADALCSAFLGIDLTKLEEEKAKELEKFFTKISYKATKEWKEEIVYHNLEDNTPLDITFIDGEKVHINGDEDPRIALAKLVIENEYFAKNFVNRIFGRLMGSYIIDPDDILNGENTNPELLDYLSKFFIKNNYDIKKLYSEILNSKTYQQSSIPLIEGTPASENFAIYTPRQAEAEVIIDMICDITNSTEIYSSMIPEPYTAMPMYVRAISIPDGSISTGFLDLFGKSQRDTGKELERKSKASPSQRMHLLNSSHIRNKINAFAFSFNNTNTLASDLDQALTYIYISILSRKETAEEKARIKKYKNDFNPNNNAFFNDIIWALINSEEFINKH